MTGLLPHSHGVLQVEHVVDGDQSVMRADTTHWASHLQAAGYHTGFFGSARTIPLAPSPLLCPCAHEYTAYHTKSSLQSGTSSAPSSSGALGGRNLRRSAPRPTAPALNRVRKRKWLSTRPSAGTTLGQLGTMTTCTTV